jgi:pyrroloquinoline quinone biosynthesis protein D
MAHHKLNAFGIGQESASRLLRNDPRDKFPSPFRRDRLLPLPAVLHDQYGYTYAANLDRAVIDSATNRQPHRDPAVVSLTRTIPKLEFGLQVITQGAQLEEAGKAFLEGLVEWSQRVITAGRRILAAHGIEPPPSQHPLLEAVQELPDPTDDWRPRRREGIQVHELGDDVLLLDSRGDKAFGLNQSAAAIWTLCEGSRTVRQSSECLAQECGADPSAVLLDVTEATRKLLRLRLIECGTEGLTMRAL